MVHFIFKFIVSTLVVFALSKLMSGVQINDWQSAAIFTLVFGFMNITVKPILHLLTLPITCLTLGLFLVIINILVVKIADHFVDGVYIDGWMNAFIFSIAMSIATSAIEFLIKPKKEETTQIM